MNNVLKRIKINFSKPNSGMELVQVAILVAIAIILGLLFKDKILGFVNGVFSELQTTDYF